MKMPCEIISRYVEPKADGTPAGAMMSQTSGSFLLLYAAVLFISCLVCNMLPGRGGPQREDLHKKGTCA